MSRPPQLSFDFSNIPADPASRNELFSDLLGTYIMWTRQSVLSSLRTKVNSEESRRDLGTLFRAVYDNVGSMAPDKREMALKLAERAIDNFAQDLLLLLSHRGGDLRLSDGHVIQFRLDMEILDPNTDTVVATEAVNRGRTYLPGRWGRWLNRLSPKARETD
jgi:hypothetical protein